MRCDEKCLYSFVANGTFSYVAIYAQEPASYIVRPPVNQRPVEEPLDTDKSLEDEELLEILIADDIV